jgi:hypothetical protein
MLLSPGTTSGLGRAAGAWLAALPRHSAQTRCELIQPSKPWWR